MADLKKVIDGLRHCVAMAGWEDQCVGCPYEEHDGLTCCRVLFRDALDLIDVREGVEPEKVNGGDGESWWYYCPECETAIDPSDKYCRRCGRELLWDGNMH